LENCGLLLNDIDSVVSDTLKPIGLLQLQLDIKHICLCNKMLSQTGLENPSF